MCTYTVLIGFYCSIVCNNKASFLNIITKAEIYLLRYSIHGCSICALTVYSLYHNTDYAISSLYKSTATIRMYLLHTFINISPKQSANGYLIFYKYGQFSSEMQLRLKSFGFYIQSMVYNLNVNGILL